MSDPDPTAEVVALRAALAAERHKGEVFAELSHELRTLIAGVTGITGLLLDTELTSEQRDYVKRVRGFSDALVGLVNNVLDYQRIEAGKLELDRADLDLRRLVDEVGELFADRACAKGVELVTALTGEAPPLRGDPTRIRQVLMNLVSNAIKFTDRGEVVLRVRIVDRWIGQGPAAPEGVVVRFEVRDTGVGIGPEGQARLFQPFSQVHAGDAFVGGAGGGAGSGLGLALSKQIVAAMDGEIGVESEIGRGSTFHFTARLERRVVSEGRGVAIPRVDMAGKRVLLAVATASSRESLAEMMEALGMVPSAGEDGAGALAAIREATRQRAPYEVIVLDLRLRGAAELMRALDHDELATPVVLLAYPGQHMDVLSDGGAAHRAPASHGAPEPRIAVRVVAQLAKPVRQAQLHACLRTLMGSSVETVGAAPDSRRSPPISRRTGPRPVLPSVPSPEPAARAEGTDERPRVLLVEDNAVNQRVTKVMMEKRGYLVEVAADGFEAVDATAQKAYAAVLMDCHMPRLDGYSATREIRAREARPASMLSPAHLPIIAMTANAGPGARERCLAAGMDDYVAKPVTAEALDAVLRRWVSRAPPLREPPPPMARRPSSPTVDLGMLRQMRASQGPGEADIVAEVIALFLQDAPARLAALREAVSRGDLVAAVRAAHTLKGSAGHLGAKTLTTLCARFEEKARAGAPFDTAPAVGAIADELDRVCAALATEG